MRLEPAGETTVLQYEVHAQVGGRIAQLGARLIDATAKQMADSFFDRFSAQVAPPAPEPETQRVYPSAPSEEAVQPVLPPLRQPPSAVSVFSLIPPEPMGLPIAAWIGGAIYLIMLILILGSMV